MMTNAFANYLLSCNPCAAEGMGHRRGCALRGAKALEDALQGEEDDGAAGEARHQQAADEAALPRKQTCRQPHVA